MNDGERYRRKVAKNLLFAGVCSDAEIMQVCEIDSGTLQSLITELAHETREQMQALRATLTYLRRDDITAEERRGEVVRVLCMLKRLLHFWRPSQREIDDISRICQGYGEDALIHMMEPLLPARIPDYELLTRGQGVLDGFYAEMAYNCYRE